MTRSWVAVINGRAYGKQLNFREMQIMKACIKNVDFREVISR